MLFFYHQHTRSGFPSKEWGFSITPKNSEPNTMEPRSLSINSSSPDADNVSALIDKGDDITWVDISDRVQFERLIPIDISKSCFPECSPRGDAAHQQGAFNVAQFTFEEVSSKQRGGTFQGIPCCTRDGMHLRRRSIRRNRSSAMHLLCELKLNCRGSCLKCTDSASAQVLYHQSYPRNRRSCLRLSSSLQDGAPTTS